MVPARASLLAIILLTCIAPAFASPDIDVVYGDDIAKRGELASELAARYAQTARNGDFRGRGLWQAVGELAYGMSDSFNLGVKIPVSRFDGAWYAHGAYAEAKYVHPHAADGFYWGGEVEAGSVKPIGEERSFSLEAFPILGFRAGRLHMVGNPGVEYSSEGEEKGWSFVPKVKISYLINDENAVGLEYHVEAGKLSNLAGRNQRTETAYATWDTKVMGRKFLLALGHGTTHRADRWAVRVGVELDD